MFTFTKAQIASLLATGVDFLVTLLLVRILKFTSVMQTADIWYLSSAVGNVSGGITNFLLGRFWVFQAREGKWHFQAGKYILVWVGNLLLNVSVLFLLTHYTGMNYLLAKIVVSIGVAVFYNYVLQKRFVFK
ncbi:MAG TPA: GtrA family protein [Puia sp.]|nr:GtrA family protein [Puia sp.]